jgi:hypothetical protein
LSVLRMIWRSRVLPMVPPDTATEIRHKSQPLKSSSESFNNGGSAAASAPATFAARSRTYFSWRAGLAAVLGRNESLTNDERWEHRRRAG